MAWMLGTIASFATMAVAGRTVSEELDTFEIMTYRSFVGIAIVVAVGLATQKLGQISTRNLHLHFARNLFHFAGQNLWFFAIATAPLAQVVSIEFTSPLWVILLAALFLGERFTAVKMVTALMGFLGVLVVSRPDLANLDPGLTAAAAAAIGFALTAVFTKLLTRQATVLCILFYITTMQAVFGLICGFLDGEMAWPSTAALPFVVLIGFAGLSAHFCLTRALSLAPASIVMPMDFLRLPLLAFVGMVFYGESLDLWVVLGAGLILTGNFINLRANAK
ncbi:DMT family transporter [Vannielia litorea]|uniref:DMT family transporter n=1 Tax=Vannielia litorea TaxID=1217970 RepID=UPI001BD05F97|nr:DMT family transporter [Vannielia litorea]MBS8228132.1 DMT family transporter [Vannielia litorea]